MYIAGLLDIQQGDALRTLDVTLTSEMAGFTCLAAADRHPWLIWKSPFGGRIMPGIDLQFCSQRQIAYHLTGSLPGALFVDPAMLLTCYDATYHAPIPVGAKVRISGSCVGRYVKRNRDYIDFSHEVMGEDGTLFARYRVSYVIAERRKAA